MWVVKKESSKFSIQDLSLYLILPNQPNSGFSPRTQSRSGFGLTPNPDLLLKTYGKTYTGRAFRIDGLHHGRSRFFERQGNGLKFFVYVLIVNMPVIGIFYGNSGNCTQCNSGSTPHRCSGNSPRQQTTCYIFFRHFSTP